MERSRKERRNGPARYHPYPPGHSPAPPKKEKVTFRRLFRYSGPEDTGRILFMMDYIPVPLDPDTFFKVTKERLSEHKRTVLFCVTDDYCSIVPSEDIPLPDLKPFLTWILDSGFFSFYFPHQTNTPCPWRISTLFLGAVGRDTLAGRPITRYSDIHSSIQNGIQNGGTKRLFLQLWKSLVPQTPAPSLTPSPQPDCFHPPEPTPSLNPSPHPDSCHPPEPAPSPSPRCVDIRTTTANPLIEDTYHSPKVFHRALSHFHGNQEGDHLYCYLRPRFHQLTICTSNSLQSTPYCSCWILRHLWRKMVLTPFYFSDNGVIFPFPSDKMLLHLQGIFERLVSWSKSWTHLPKTQTGPSITKITYWVYRVLRQVLESHLIKRIEN